MTTMERFKKVGPTMVYRECLKVLLVLLATLLPLASHAQASETDTEFYALVDQVASGSLSKRIKTVDAIAELNHTRSAAILEALQEGALKNARGKEGLVVIEIANDQYVDAKTGEPIIDKDLGRLKRVPIHNKLRGQIRTLLAQINLSSADEEIRLSAVTRLITDGGDADTAELLQSLKANETSAAVVEAMNTAIALYRIESDDATVRLYAVKQLRGSLIPEVRGPLKALVTNDPDKAVRIEAERAIDSIEGKLKMFRFGENVFFGLSLGSVFLLSAIGLAITFGVMGVINMAHGELMMIGAYTTWVIQQAFPNQIEYSLFMAIPAAFVVAGLVGIAIERGVIQFLYGRPLETLLATFGISLILQQAARSIFSPLNRAVSLPEWMSGSLQINPALSITFNRLYILLFGLMVFFALMAILKKTSLGLKVRAVSQNRPMARAVGVRASWVDALTFGLGSGIAGIAGVALSQLTNVGPNLGQAYIIDSFMVVVFGGVGNLWGTLVGAMGLGIVNKFLEPYAGAVLAKVLILVMLILFIQKKPKGLFPQKGRAAAD
ncbi:urea ABC transporter permease subunit UrtB [Gilvimarinus gilvus]